MVRKKPAKSRLADIKSENVFYYNDEQFALFQNLIDNIPDHIYIKDVNSRFLVVNKAKANFMDREPQDFIGKTDLDFFPQQKSEEYLKDENYVMKTGKPIIDKVGKVLYKDKEFWTSSSKIPWYDKNGNIMGTMGISRDITKRKQMENGFLRKERDFFNALMDNITESIYFKDVKSRFVRINKACAEKFELDRPEDAEDKTDFDFFSKEHAKQAFEDEQSIIKTGNAIIDFEEKETFENKTDKWVSTSKIPWYDKNGNIVGIFGITKDITNKKNAEEKIKYLSFHDSLTELYNRAYFEEEINRLDTPRQLPLTIVMGDVNGLKTINDAYGHVHGDTFLIKIADILKDSFREEDIVSRWGGDEFIAILPKTTAKDTASIVKRIKRLCRERSTPEMPLSISIGVSTKRKPLRNIDDILKEAEDKMYKNKIAESKSTNEIIISSLKENLKKGEHGSEENNAKLRKYALYIGRKLNLSEVKLNELKLLMDVYNIGKLTLADEIIAKPGRLTKEEWKLVKKLPELEAILSHYEWYNGDGYPRGIKGEDIPILSRISFLINSYDAMSKDRPYRRKMTKKEIIQEFKKFYGIQFDPNIVKIFLELLEKKHYR